MARSVADLCQEHQITLEELIIRSGLEQARVSAIVAGRWTPSPVACGGDARVLGLWHFRFWQRNVRRAINRFGNHRLRTPPKEKVCVREIRSMCRGVTLLWIRSQSCL